MSEICVVHLVWAPLGADCFRLFLASYRENRGGADHQLLVVFNGFRDERELSSYYELLGGLSCRTLFLSRPVQDIPAYFAAVREFPCKYYCFLNSYSEPLVCDWLAKMYAHIGERVGVVGATGSWESHYTNLLRATHPLKYLRTAGVMVLRARRPESPLAYLARRRQLVRSRRDFDPFPNCHVRTNTFLMARELLLGLEVGEITNKMDAVRFESGKAGLTRQLSARGLRALVVGRDGRAYDERQWYESHTFRSGCQENLLVADNRTRQYAEADSETRKYLCEAAWGRQCDTEGA